MRKENQSYEFFFKTNAICISKIILLCNKRNTENKCFEMVGKYGAEISPSNNYNTIID